MTELDSMQRAITGAAIQVAIVAVMALKGADIGPTTGANMVNAWQAHSPRHADQALRQLAFNWKAPEKYIQLLKFEMEIKIFSKLEHTS